LLPTLPLCLESRLARIRDDPAEYQVFAGSDLDWTLVRPPRLTDAPATTRINHDPHIPGHWAIPRADLATFLVDTPSGAEDELVQGPAEVRTGPPRTWVIWRR